jgi:hypothetical protein
VAPDGVATPNQMFCADLVFLTPEGAILARPASTVRAGEERQVARRLADIGVPIVRTLRGTATFEGADAMWLDSGTVMVGKGLRTNAEAVWQIKDALFELDVDTLEVDLPFGTMHFMGLLRASTGVSRFAGGAARPSRRSGLLRSGDARSSGCPRVTIWISTAVSISSPLGRARS